MIPIIAITPDPTPKKRRFIKNDKVDFIII